jgi:hypothetical protein
MSNAQILNPVKINLLGFSTPIRKPSARAKPRNEAAPETKTKAVTRKTRQRTSNAAPMPATNYRQPEVAVMSPMMSTYGALSLAATTIAAITMPNRISDEVLNLQKPWHPFTPPSDQEAHHHVEAHADATGNDLEGDVAVEDFGMTAYFDSLG